MKQLTSLDLYYLVKELQGLAGARVQKVYQIKDTVYIVLYKETKQTLIIAPHRISITEYEHDYPLKPLMFCMLLRKHLKNKKIISVKQHGFDRIIELEFPDRFLIIELFSHGNIILTDKNTGEIIKPLHAQKWKDRNVLPRVPYAYPPEGVDTAKVTEEEFMEIMRGSEKDVVRTLATKFSFGGTYAEEVCYNSNIYTDTLGADLNDATLKKIYKHVKSLFEQNLAPKYYDKEGFLAPFELKNTESEPRTFTLFSQACDEYFEETIVERDEHDKLKRILEEQKVALKQLKEDAVKQKEKGDNLSQEQKFAEAGKAYDKSKKDKKKIKGAQEAIEKTKKDLEKAQVIVKPPKKKAPVSRKWYEKFRWFKSSDGFLVVGGKDAATNDLVVKKHTEKTDAVFHAEIIGAPFCVVKAGKKEIPDTTLEEAAQFAASYSKAWQKGLGTVNVYWVHPNQLKKELGLPAGAFMVRGERNYYHNVVLGLAFCVDKKGTLYHGPVKTIEKLTRKFVRVQPGREKSGLLAKKIAHKLKYKENAENIQKFIPAGKGALK